MRCAHASAVGPVDEEQRWYLESRGVPDRDRRAAHRGRLLRRGDRRPAGPRRHRAAARSWSTASSTGPTGPTADGGRLCPGRPRRRRSATLRRRRPAGRRRAHRRRPSTPSATGAPTPTSRWPRARSTPTCCTIECWKHGSLFDLRTGEPLSLPATRPTPVYEAKVVDGRVVVDLVTLRHELRDRRPARRRRWPRHPAGHRPRGAQRRGPRRHGPERVGQVHPVARARRASPATRSPAARSPSTASTSSPWRRGSGPRPGCSSPSSTRSRCPGVSLIDVLRESLVAAGRPIDGLHELLRREADAIGFDERFLDRPLNVDLSGGEKKRNETVQLGVLDPKIAVLDEIDSGLDVDALRAVSRRIEAVTNEEGLGVLAITHYSRLLTELRPDRVHVLARGRIAASGRPGAGRGARAHRLRRLRRHRCRRAARRAPPASTRSPTRWTATRPPTERGGPPAIVGRCTDRSDPPGADAGGRRGGAGAAVAIAQQPDDEPDAVVVAAHPFELRGEGEAAALVPIHRFNAAEAMVPALDRVRRPEPAAGRRAGGVPAEPDPRGLPARRVDPRADDDGTWLWVRLPQRPNGLTGWVRAADVRRWMIPNRIEVDPQHPHAAGLRRRQRRRAVRDQRGHGAAEHADADRRLLHRHRQPARRPPRLRLGPALIVRLQRRARALRRRHRPDRHPRLERRQRDGHCGVQRLHPHAQRRHRQGRRAGALGHAGQDHPVSWDRGRRQARRRSSRSATSPRRGGS